MCSVQFVCALQILINLWHILDHESYTHFSTWNMKTFSCGTKNDWKFLVTCFSGALKFGSKSHLKQLHVNSQLSSSSQSWRICFGSNVLTYARVTSLPASKWHEACGKEHITNMKSYSICSTGMLDERWEKPKT